jgi:hypothetical protein
LRFCKIAMIYPDFFKREVNPAIFVSGLSLLTSTFTGTDLVAGDSLEMSTVFGAAFLIEDSAEPCSVLATDGMAGIFLPVTALLIAPLVAVLASFLVVSLIRFLTKAPPSPVVTFDLPKPVVVVSAPVTAASSPPVPVTVLVF